MRRLGILLVLAVMAAASAAQAALRIEITQGAEGALPIAVMDFAWNGAGPRPESLGEVISGDLRRSGRFDLLESGRSPQGTVGVEDLDLSAWREAGVESLVWGRMRPRGQGTVVVEFRLFDTIGEQQLLGQRLRVPTSDLRWAAHNISDRIYEELIGTSGAFATHIAYITAGGTGDQRRYQLRVAESDGYDPRTIYDSGQPLMSPAWSPDGSKLAYVSFEARRPAVYVQDLASAERRQVLATSGINGAPAWSPDGERLAVTSSHEGNPEIYVLELASGELERVTHNAAIDTEPAWMPQGGSLVFTSDRSGSPQIYRVALNAGEPERLTFEGSYNADASVSPDGGQLALVHRHRGDFRIAMLELATGSLRVLTEGRLDESPSFAPNGSMILYGARGERGRGVLAAVSEDGRVHQRLIVQKGEVREPAWSPYRQ